MATAALGTARQFLRYSELSVAKSSTGESLILSSSDLPEQSGLSAAGLRFTFQVRASDVATPNNATIRVYNVADSTRNKVQEFDKVTLVAGYEQGNQGIVFVGDVKRYFFGREKNVDGFLQIDAGDGDVAYNQATLAQSFAPGSTDADQLSVAAKSMGIPLASTATGFLEAGGTNPSVRGKVWFGMARGLVEEIAYSNGCRWSIQSGELTMIKNTSYLPGQTIEINSSTGMIGTPESTEDGVVFRCLLNPLLHVGRLVHISSNLINQYQIIGNGNFDFPSIGAQFFPATVTADGTYRILVVEHQGDSRGSDWFSECVCLAVDVGAPANNSVAAG